MSDPFRQQIHTALANPVLQAALDANAEKRINVRKEAFASLPGYEDLRQQAHALRAAVIANLDTYVEQFAQKASQNGIQVHPAADAAQAVQIVLEIARQHKARLVAKSKTMVGEEIELNQALEKAGLQVVETDLGEYIVQLRGERPAHIITPAVHLRRQEVGQTFHEKLGEPLTEDITAMTAAARRILRQVFLNADIGISGVNFGVAETGTLCVLTNEGNGRLVTTLPKVHIALMGIERLVPTLNDLALMLELLPRSATGQKMTVYASLLHGPRRPQDPDGPDERHLILLDNGRRLIRSSPLAEVLYCIRCGACLNACPVFRELGGHAYVGAGGEPTPYTGPIGSVLSPALFGQPEFSNLARASSLCGACKEACPVDIDLPSLLLKVRAGLVQPSQTKPVTNAPRSLRMALNGFTWVATSPRRFAFAQKLAGLGARLISPRRAWMRLPALTGWGYSKDFPRPALKTFRERWGAKSADKYTGTQVDRETGIQGAREVVREGNGDGMAGRFEQELALLGGQALRCQAEQAAAIILGLLQARGIERLQTWDKDLPGGLLEQLKAAGIQMEHATDESIQAGLTGALAGAAETASLALPGGSGRPLTASLLPGLHIAILKEGDIYESLAEMIKLPELHEASASALVTGPSRTADIEMSLTIGMHGPKELVVLIISPESGSG